MKKGRGGRVEKLVNRHKNLIAEEIVD